MTLQNLGDRSGSPPALPTSPRWFSIGVGIFLALAALLLGWAGIGSFVLTDPPKRMAMLPLSLAALAGALLCSSVSRRLIFNLPRRDGGLLSPWFLRCAGAGCVLLPVAAIATGSWRESGSPPAFLTLQVIVYLGAAVTLFRLARSREHGA
jgi:hypothetical protein